MRIKRWKDGEMLRDPNTTQELPFDGENKTVIFRGKTNPRKEDTNWISFVFSTHQTFVFPKLLDPLWTEQDHQTKGFFLNDINQRERKGKKTDDSSADLAEQNSPPPWCLPWILPGQGSDRRRRGKNKIQRKNNPSWIQDNDRFIICTSLTLHDPHKRLAPEGIGQPRDDRIASLIPMAKHKPEKKANVATRKKIPKMRKKNRSQERFRFFFPSILSSFFSSFFFFSSSSDLIHRVPGGTSQIHREKEFIDQDFQSFQISDRSREME